MKNIAVMGLGTLKSQQVTARRGISVIYNVDGGVAWKFESQGGNGVVFGDKGCGVYGGTDSGGRPHAMKD